MDFLGLSKTVAAQLQAMDVANDHQNDAPTIATTESRKSELISQRADNQQTTAEAMSWRAFRRICTLRQQ